MWLRSKMLSGVSVTKNYNFVYLQFHHPLFQIQNTLIGQTWSRLFYTEQKFIILSQLVNL